MGETISSLTYETNRRCWETGRRQQQTLKLCPKNELECVSWGKTKNRTLSKKETGIKSWPRSIE